MKIARLVRDGKETYGLIKDDRVATKDDITYQTGIPIPLNIKDFLLKDGMMKLKTKYLTPLSKMNLKNLDCLHQYRIHQK